MLWLETSLKDLHKNTIEAFPNTQKRQYATDTIVFEHLDWVPFLGVKTLFIKGLAKNNGRKNESLILFKNIKYKESEGRGTVPITASNGKEYYLEQIQYESNDVLVRCSCKDFFWRFTHFNKIDKSLFGRDRRKYEAIYKPGSSNPEQIPGLCKHLIKLIKVLKESNLLK